MFQVLSDTGCAARRITLTSLPAGSATMNNLGQRSYLIDHLFATGLRLQ